MENKSNLNSVNLSELVLVDEENKFYCEKCYDMVNYFINECLTISPQLSDLKKRFAQLDKYTFSLKNKYETLEFNYEEEKAQREDLEERLKSENKKKSLVCINSIDADLRDFYIQSNINNHFFLDLECLTKQTTIEITINFEAIYKHFAQKANEYRKVNSNKLMVFKQKLTRDQPKFRKESDELTVECFKKEIAVNDEQIKLLSEENEQLKKKNALLNESLDAFKLENEMLKTSCNKLQDSFQNLSIKHEQTENQAIQFEAINQELMEDLKKYTESQKLVDELSKKMSAIENEKDNLKNLNKMLLERSKTPRTSLNANEGNDNSKDSHLRIEKENQQLLAKIEILNNELNQIRANLSNSNEMIDNLNLTIFDQNQASSKLNSEHAAFKRDSEETIKALNATITDYSQNIEALKEEIKLLKSKEENELHLKENEVSKEAEIAALVSEIKNLKAGFEQANTSNKQIENEQFEITNENLAAKENQIASLTEEISELKASVEKWCEMHKELEFKLSEKTSQMNLLEAEFHEKNEQMKTHHENLLNEIRLELTAKNTEKSEYNSQLEHFQSLNSELNQKLNDNLNQIEILKQVEIKLNEEIKIYQSDLEQSRKKAESFSQEKEDYNKRLEELQAAKLQVENDLSNKSEILNNLNSKQSELQGELQNENKKLAEELNELAAKLQTSEENFNNIKSKFSEMENSNCQYQQINTDLKRELDEFRTSYEQSQASNQELSDQFNSLKSESETLQNVNNELNELLAGLRNDYAQMQDKNSFLSTQLSESNNQLNIFQNANNELNVQLNETNINLKETHTKINELGNQLNELNKRYKESQYRINELTNQSAEFESQCVHFQSKFSQDKQSADNLISSLNNELVELKNVKQNQALRIENDEKLIQKLQAQIETTSQEKQVLTKQIKECDGVKMLELANLKRYFTDNECVLEKQIQELSIKTQTQEKQIVDQIKVISSLQKELSEMRSEMIENENELVSLKKSFEQKLVDRVEHCKQEVVDFQIKYDEACRENANLKSEYERTIKDSVSNDSNLNAVIVELTNELNNRDNELNSLKKKMVDYESEINTILSTNQHKAELINEWIEKYNQQENELNQADLKSKSLCEEVSCLNGKLLELTNEKDETLRMIEEFSSKVTEMSQEKNALTKEIEMKEKEIMELRGKLCKTLEELASDRKTQQDSQIKYQNKISQLEYQLKQTQLEFSNKSLISKASNINESFIDRKIDNRFDANLHQKLDVLYEEKYKQVAEIERLNNEIKVLKGQMETQKEKIVKENKKLNKEQMHSLEKTISKQTNEITKLKETIGDLQETNSFLTSQINNLNQQIYELSNKENDFELIENANSKPKLSKQLNKGLLDSSLNSDLSPNSNFNKHLASIDMNSSSNKASKMIHDLNESTSTPSNVNKIPTVPATPSTSARKQNQCAQQ